MSASGATVKYDVAISFLSADLGVAQELAAILRERMNVFLFTERQADIVGSDGVETLSEVFRSTARLVVVMFRSGWEENSWTGVEATAIKERGLQSGWESLLVMCLDPTPQLPAWIPKSRIWLGYSVYGLGTALPVVERMLEEMGGTATPPSAAAHVRRLAREARWQVERGRLLEAMEGVEEAHTQVKAVFSEIEQAVKSPDAAGADVAFKVADQRAARLWSSRPDHEGTTVTLYWSQQWGNTLKESGLRVKLFEGYAAAGNEHLVRSKEPVELERHEFDIDVIDPGLWMWRNRETGRTCDTASLAAFCMELLASRISES